MDENKTHNRQYRATHINPDLRKAQSDITLSKGLHGIIKLIIIIIGSRDR